MIPLAMVVFGLLLGASDPEDMNDFMTAKVAAAALIVVGIALLRAMVPPEER